MKRDPEQLKQEWEAEEQCAHIHGWDFSHIAGRYEEEGNLPWDYDTIVRQYLAPDTKVLDYDTGGGEFLLSLGHPYHMTSATEGYPPNVELCRNMLLPLGIDFRECSSASAIPFDDESFDLVINRHGDFDPHEIYRLLKPGGYFVTQQVGSQNDRDLVERVLPTVPAPFPDENLTVQAPRFLKEGFTLVQTEEAFRPIIFYDIGAFVWFARIIQWEFPGFSVSRCFDELTALQKEIEEKGKITGTIHRYLIVAQKPRDGRNGR